MTQSPTPFENLPEDAKRDASLQGYQKGYGFLLKIIGDEEILEILNEKGITSYDITLWKGTTHYSNLKKDIEKNGIKTPTLGYEGIHRMLICLDLGISLPHYEPIPKK
jgi:hypothetical protein